MKTRYLCSIIFSMLLNGCEKEGPEGKKSLIKIVNEPAGENCISGGFKINTGIDLNNNDILDGNEIQSAEYLCNGNDGANGIGSLLNVIPEAEGNNCSAGGYKVVSGLDLNINNVLDNDEIQHTEFICNNNSMLIHEVSFDFGYTTFAGQSTYDWIITGEIRDFNMDNYQNTDSVCFGAYLKSSNSNTACQIELLDVTHNKVINGSLVSTTSTTNEWVNTNNNFIHSMPVGKVTLAIRLSAVPEGDNVVIYSPTLKLIHNN